MKKTVFTLMLMIGLSMGLANVTKANAKSKFAGSTLTIYNVEDYISNGEDGYVDLIAEFEELYDVKVNYYTYDTNETMYNQFTLQKEGTYDLICTSDYMIQKMIKQELVIPMEDYAEKIPNYEKYASKALREKLKQMEVPYQGKTVNLDEFAVGYMWGTLGIVYDPTCSDTICEDVKSWDVFWDPKYKDLISIKNSIRDAFVAGLMHAYSQDETFQNIKNAYLENPTEENQLRYNQLVQDIFDFKLDGSLESDRENKEKIARVKQELISMKENIFGFEVDSGKNDIVTGRIKLNLAYSGDAVFSIDTAEEEQGKRLEYYVPEDGSNIWYDAWTIPKGAKNIELAYLFLDYLSDPINAASNMDYIGYTPYIVGDELFTLAGAWYGATDYAVNCEYLAENESMVIYENQLYCCIKDKPADVMIYPDNEEYFELCAYDSEEEYEEGDMVSYDGKIYHYIAEEAGIVDAIEQIEVWQEVEAYDLSYLFEGTLSEGRHAVIYPFLGYENKLQTQYPSENLIARCAIMNDFDSYNEQVVIMWSQVKAYTNMVPVYIFLVVTVMVVIGLSILYVTRKHITMKYKKRMSQK